MADPMRLQRFLAQGGVASRRHCEKLITDGKVRVNGQVVTELGTKVDPDADKVVVDGRRILVERPAYLLLHKPRGYVTTADDPEGRPTVMELIRRRGERGGQRLYPVGRLDFNTEGVLLLTNDGDLAFALMHPRHGIEKTYHAKLQGELTVPEIEQLRAGVTLDDGTVTRPAGVHVVGDTGKHTWLEITLREGKNRQIHRMAESIGRRLLKLTRVAYAGLTVEGLRPGHWRPLSPAEVEALREAVGARVTQVRKRAPAPDRRRATVEPRRPPGRRHR
jgi:23S rRNA pseudouridine2605 synthase